MNINCIGENSIFVNTKKNIIMITNVQKIKSLSRADLRQINGGVRPPVPNCDFLCGGGGGVVSNTPGVGDVCTPDRRLCCICR